MKNIKWILITTMLSSLTYAQYKAIDNFVPSAGVGFQLNQGPVEGVSNTRKIGDKVPSTLSPNAGVKLGGKTNFTTFNDNEFKLDVDVYAGKGLQNKSNSFEIGLKGSQELLKGQDYSISAFGGVRYKNFKLVTKGETQGAPVKGVMFTVWRPKADGSGQETVENVYIPIEEIERFNAFGNAQVSQLNVELGIQQDFETSFGLLSLGIAYYHTKIKQKSNLKNVKVDFDKKSLVDINNNNQFSNDTEFNVNGTTMTIGEFRTDNPDYEIRDLETIYADDISSTDYLEQSLVDAAEKINALKVVAEVTPDISDRRLKLKGEILYGQNDDTRKMKIAGGALEASYVVNTDYGIEVFGRVERANKFTNFTIGAKANIQ